MRAVVVERPGGPEVLGLREVAMPEPRHDEVAIDVDFAGVGWVDTLFRDGTFRLDPPFVPGIEVTGRVRAVGDAVDGLRPGDSVAAVLNDFGRGSRAGGYAEVAIARADLVIPVPASLDRARVAGALVNGATAWIGLDRVPDLSKIERAYVLGVGGGVGAASANLLAERGVREVIGVTSRPDRAPAARAAGCTTVMSLPDLSHEAAPDAQLIIDPVGGEPQAAALQRLAPFGTLLLFGSASGRDGVLSTDRVWQSTWTVTGVSLGGIAHLAPEVVRRAMQNAAGVLGRPGTPAPAPVVRPLVDAAAVHAELASGRGPGKVVLSTGRHPA